MGGRVYKEIYSKRESISKHYKSLDNFFKNHPEIKAVHMHMNNINFITPLKYAKKYNIPLKIYHSHNSGNMFGEPSQLFKLMENYNRKILKKYTDKLIACSEDAGKWMFGSSKFQVIKNAINAKEFTFNEYVRVIKRKELGIDNKKVVGFVGRLQYQKNPEFLIDVFKEIYKRDKDTVLLIVGLGDLEEKIKVMINNYNLEKAVIFLGARTDVSELMQAFDLFILPSRFEGFGIVLIEAQAAGLPCLASAKVIPDEVKVTDLLEFVDLELNPGIWAEKALEKLNIKRRNTYEEIKDAGYDIKTIVKEIENFYLS